MIDIKELTEKQIVEKLYVWQKEGVKSRQDLTPNPYKPNTLCSFMHTNGWLQEDLRIALMEANPTYEISQRSAGQGLDSLSRAAKTCG